MTNRAAVVTRLRAIGTLTALTALLTVGACGSSDPGPAVAAHPAGLVADDGFKPVVNGLPFFNYGNALSSGAVPDNMTAADVQKMFGDAVCVDPTSRTCGLTPEAKAWLDSINQEMAGGHCYGFSVLANLMWQGNIPVTAYGAPSPTGLRIDGNQALQREIAYDWALQTLGSVTSRRISGTPNKILTTLMSVLKPNPTETYTIVFWKRDNTGGHAVTPYAVKSKGDGKYDVLIYDNNWPGKTRAISFDTKANTWTYNASTNPNERASLYEGDAGTKTISLDPGSPGLGTQPCPFCGRVPKTGSVSAERNNTEQILLTGPESNQPSLVITDTAGHKLGFINGKFINQIRGSRYEPVISTDDWTNKGRPNFFVPADNKYTITLDGTGLPGPVNDTVTIVGPSYDLSIGNITIKPGEKDTLVTEPDVTHLSYTASQRETPIFELGVSDSSADYSFTIKGISDQPGSTLNLFLPAEGAALSLQNVGSKSTSTVDFKMTRQAGSATQTFQHLGIPLAGSEKATLTFGSWTDPSQPIPLTSSRAGRRSTQPLENQPAG